MSEVIIIGGGVAGLSASIFTAKAGLKTTVFDFGPSQITRVSLVQNIPGFPNGIAGTEWIEQAKQQATKFNVEIKNEKVTELMKNDDGSFEVKTENGSYQAKYVIVATNVQKELLEAFGFTTEVNSRVPNGKAKAIINIPWTGETEVENLYLAGLITEIPSQTVVVAGQGAAVGITIASKEKGEPFMWHDL
ncbi:NAD(P)/FAD-dependent oxidoreductase [Tepidibacillus sp. HK-1]|uniref:NAD(P)/FAD-dependent oxidoreductase n=1 Tax=Tepidibacillus sp. HK-1 TaxID=1883407 RepID=UPI000853856C|nr:NAD(P)/FAD-dependent oxidoreductase [Tepidibacillus sp. HK-1]GBF10227.1 thioredoxin reductase [Tepidibacillus sp. HK-1]